MEKAKPHILVVDDDHIFCMVLSDMLKHGGYHVTSVFSARKSLDILRKKPHDFDVIILDRIMPELSGLEVLHKLCLMPVVRDIPVIMLTSHAEAAHLKTANIYGVFEMHYKPIEDSVLLAAVGRALESKADKHWE